MALIIPVMAEMLATVRFDHERMRRAAAESFSLATDIADYLVEKGAAFRDAHRITGELVRYCIDRDMKLEELSLEELKERSELFDEGFAGVVDLDAALARKASYGGTAPEEVRAQLESAAGRLEGMRQAAAEAAAGGE
jgi:argininosuccinate lyase